MAIVIVGKDKPARYRITCTDQTCRNIIEFDRDDVTMVSNSVMGLTTKTTEGISCPDCRQILALKDATEIT